MLRVLLASPVLRDDELLPYAHVHVPSFDTAVPYECRRRNSAYAAAPRPYSTYVCAPELKIALLWLAFASGFLSLTQSNSPQAMTTPWVEKYRPKTVEDVCHQEEAIATLKNALETGNLPHLLFYGPPGTGKTSAVSAMVRQMFGPVVKDRVLELNASDERGIDVVREKIKVFAKLAVGGLPPGFTCPPLKIIVLDEADCMTSDAQSALRRTMEQHSRVTRFCIMCNYVSRIIDPITSRCAKFRFSPLPASAMTSRLQHIAEQESVTFSDGSLDALMLASAGDMRRAVSLMQNAASLDCNRVNTETIFSCAAVVPQPMVDSLFQVSPSLAILSICCVESSHHDGPSFRPACKELSMQYNVSSMLSSVRGTRRRR